MLTYSISDRGDKSIYQYLYERIRDDIVSGVLMPHDKLPSKRAFAANNGVSVITVENTYGQLMAEGYIYSRPKSGFFVSPIDSQIDFKNPQSDLIFRSENSSGSDSYMMANKGKNNHSGRTSAGSSQDFSGRSSGDININLISGHTPSDSFPFSIWAKIMRQVMTRQQTELLSSPPTGGVYELRSAIAKHLHDFRGIDCQPGQIIIGAGTEYLYGLIVQLLGRDKIYGLENPSSKKIRKIYEALGVKAAPLDMDEEGIKLTNDNLTLPDIIQISPSHHFPTGIITSVSRRYGLLQWANENNNRYIIEDDYDSEFRLAGKPVPSLFSIDATSKVIYFNTFTKSLASTIRISYMVLPKALLETFDRVLGFYSCTVSNFEQYTLAGFIEGQYFEKHINRMRKRYKLMRDSLIENIRSSQLKTGVSITQENSGLHFIMELNTKMSDDFLREKALEKGINISFMSDYLSFNYKADYKSSREKYSHKVIVNYSGLSKDEVMILPGRLEAAWKDYLK